MWNHLRGCLEPGVAGWRCRRATALYVSITQHFGLLSLKQIDWFGWWSMTASSANFNSIVHPFGRKRERERVTSIGRIWSCRPESSRPHWSSFQARCHGIFRSIRPWFDIQSAAKAYNQNKFNYIEMNSIKPKRTSLKLGRRNRRKCRWDASQIDGKRPAESCGIGLLRANRNPMNWTYWILPPEEMDGADLRRLLPELLQSSQAPGSAEALRIL